MYFVDTLVSGIGGGEHSFERGVGVVGSTWPYDRAAAKASERARAVSINIKQMSVSDFTHWSLLVVILVIPSEPEQFVLSFHPSFPRRTKSVSYTLSSCFASLAA